MPFYMRNFLKSIYIEAKKKKQGGNYSWQIKIRNSQIRIIKIRAR